MYGQLEKYLMNKMINFNLLYDHLQLENVYMRVTEHFPIE